jgi:hypothetical protein
MLIMLVGQHSPLPLRAGINLAFLAVFCSPFFSVPLAAQENGNAGSASHWSYYGGLEFNRFSPGTNPAIGVTLGYSPLENRYAVLSLRALASHDFSRTFGSDFVWRFQFPLLYRTKTQLLIGIEQGLSYTTASETDKQLNLSFNGILSARIFLGNQFFIEPYGRIGFPVLYAGGILTGMRYDYNEKE